jgi:prophage DNA circulation protein
MADPPWFQRLQPASFRGIPFFVLQHELASGRRGPDYEYPDSNIGSVEDTGGKIDKFKLDAYLIGDEYDLRADELIEALRIAGPGTLVHPRYGERDVICRDWSRVEEGAEGGIARFSLSFTDAPGDGGLTITIAADIDDTADTLITAASASFDDTYATTGFPGSVSDAAVLDVVATIRRIQTALLRAPVDAAAAIAISEPDIDVAVLIANPDQIADAIADIWAVAPFEAIRAFVLARPTDTNTASVTDANELQRITNENAMSAIAQRLALAEYARQAVPLVEDTFSVYDDAIELRDEYADLVRVEEETTNADEYDALIGARTDVHSRITDVAEPLVRLRTIVLKHTTNALVLAWDLYEDATRAVEIIDRNAIRHGGFIAAGTELRVLAE